MDASISFSNLQNADSTVIIHVAVAERNKTSCRIYGRPGRLAEHEFISRGDSSKNLNGKNMVSEWT